MKQTIKVHGGGGSPEGVVQTTGRVRGGKEYGIAKLHGEIGMVLKVWLWSLVALVIIGTLLTI